MQANNWTQWSTSTAVITTIFRHESLIARHLSGVAVTRASKSIQCVVSSNEDGFMYRKITSAKNISYWQTRNRYQHMPRDKKRIYRYNLRYFPTRVGRGLAAFLKLRFMLDTREKEPVGLAKCLVKLERETWTSRNSGWSNQNSVRVDKTSVKQNSQLCSTLKNFI